mmetsp:Transcript_4264/g.10299  ORF Transcript_4264/g.10299 Transcript_4264/m.10299 type:complete len:240 (+) Transcript_4264:172-891(+)|eukprot:CAMPEP_0172396926 /NCGR_PEP_ID=MMETSP1061-20121228/27871_1 /TAXON_ID=37318 /ORGANISM="Pseudo-nitzschia pungens, Strain cf. pungens" /LENGTH=239 /DNA_ID=CAMNT_0013128923 /DNA_START=146 /DNA_END=865 /DNA_ORIENTATION=-
MNLNEETHSTRLLTSDEYEAAALSDRFELELSPTEIQQPNNNDTNGRDLRGGASGLFGAAKGRISEEIVRAVRSHQIREARNEHRARSCGSVLLHALAVSLCTVPVGVFALEMIPERCNMCLDEVELETFFVASAVCGGFGAILFVGDDLWDYFVAKFLGGAASSLGALFTVWMVLRSIASESIVVAVMVLLLVGSLGAMPGVLVYFLVKIVSDECWVSDLKDLEDDFSSLTKLVTAQV